MYKALCFFVLIFFSACSGEKPPEIKQQKPQEAAVAVKSYSIEIAPSEARRSSTIVLTPKGFNLADAKIEWLVNDSPAITRDPGQFNASETRKNSRIQAKAVIQGLEILSNFAEIKNSPPEMSAVKIMPEVFKPGDTLYIEAAATDIDGDETTIKYEWTKNKGAAGTDKQIGSPVKRGDKIEVKITPFDGEEYGRSVVIRRTLGNLPPVIADDMKFTFENDVYTYQVKATDPDGDALKYSLKTAPEGMTIDDSGMVKWHVPAEFKGKAEFKVSVSDGQSGEATKGFFLNVAEGK